MHRLHNTWCFWGFTKTTAEGKTTEDSFKEGLVKISSFDTIEGFANLYRELKPVSELADGSHYFVFREKEAPVWEEHTNGCLYTLYLISGDVAEHNKLWEKVLITLLSEQFFNESIIGAEVGFKKEDKKSVISIWTKTGKRPEIKKRIAEALEKLEITQPIEARTIRNVISSKQPVTEQESEKIETEFLQIDKKKDKERKKKQKQKEKNKKKRAEQKAE